MSIFSNYKSQAPQFQQVPEGVHTFNLVQVLFDLDSHHNWDGSEKDDTPSYQPCPQIGVLLKCDKGVIPYRFNGETYLKWKDLTEKQRNSGKYEELNGFAIVAKTGLREPLDDDHETSQKARAIFDDFVRALGYPEGSGLEVLERAIEEKVQFQAKVSIRKEEGFNDQLKVGSWKAIKKPETEPEPEKPAKGKGKHSAQRLDEF